MVGYSAHACKELWHYWWLSLSKLYFESHLNACNSQDRKHSHSLNNWRHILFGQASHLFLWMKYQLGVSLFKINAWTHEILLILVRTRKQSCSTYRKNKERRWRMIDSWDSSFERLLIIDYWAWASYVLNLISTHATHKIGRTATHWIGGTSFSDGLHIIFSSGWSSSGSCVTLQNQLTKFCWMMDKKPPRRIFKINLEPVPTISVFFLFTSAISISNYDLFRSQWRDRTIEARKVMLSRKTKIHEIRSSWVSTKR